MSSLFHFTSRLSRSPPHLVSKYPPSHRASWTPFYHTSAGGNKRTNRNQQARRAIEALIGTGNTSGGSPGNARMTMTLKTAATSLVVSALLGSPQAEAFHPSFAV